MGVIRGLTRPLPVPGPLGVPGPYKIFPGTRLKTTLNVLDYVLRMEYPKGFESLGLFPKMLFGS